MEQVSSLSKLLIKVVSSAIVLFSQTFRLFLRNANSLNYTSRIVPQNSELTAKYQHPLVQMGQKIPEGLDLQMGVPL